MAQRRRRPKNATPRALPGGDGGPTPDAPGFVRRLRRDLMQGERAVRWGMTPEMRAEWLKTAEKWRKHPNARVSLRALQLIAAIEAQNQADQHLKARLENSGLALAEARRTFETMPDGSTKETQVMKLWGVGTPMEDV